jgi:hypothetical protein
MVSLAFQAFTQSVDLEYLRKWVLDTEPNAKFDSVRVFIIDGNYIEMSDGIALNGMLAGINQKDVKTILYSRMKTCGYQPGLGTVAMVLIKKRTPEDVGRWISSISKEFKRGDKPVLIIDGKKIEYKELDAEVKKIDRKQIFDILVTSEPMPTFLFGPEGKNGVIQIWTKHERRK